MPAGASEIAVAFVIREKFACTLASLQRLYALAGAPFTLYLVDGGYPPGVRDQIERFLSGRDNVVRIEAGRFLYPSEALNLVVERAAEPYLLLLQNDVMIGRDAARYALDAMREAGCDVVVPLVFDVEAGAPAAHRDTDEPFTILDEEGRVFVERTAAVERLGGRPRVHRFEMHCVLLKTAAARALIPLPPLNVQEHIDLCVALWRAGKSACLEPRSRVLFVGSPPLPLRDFECPYYRFRWDPVRAQQSDEHVREKWRLADLHDIMPFVHWQLTAVEPGAFVTRYDSLFETDSWPEEIAAG